MQLPHHADSYYLASANQLPEFPVLEESGDCDVCIVGGGFTGLSCALHLAEAGVDVVVLEAARVGWGASGRNGGQLGSGQRQDQVWLEQRLGFDRAKTLWLLAQESKSLVLELIDRLAIECDLKPGILNPGHTAAEGRWGQHYAEKLARDYGYSQARPVGVDEMRSMLGTRAYHGGWLDSGAAHLHPLNYALGLATGAAAAGARIFEASRVGELRHSRNHRVSTAAGEIRANAVVVACNGYLGRLVPALADRVMPINNFILATERLGADTARAIIRDDVAVADSRFVINYFRLSADQRLLFGGGENYTRRFPRDIKRFVRRYMLKVYPQLVDTAIDYAWGGTLGVTLSRMPHFGRLQPNVFFAQGYSGHGVGMATLAGKLIAEAVSGRPQRFDIFAGIPTPRFPGGRWLRWPALALGMSYYALRDRF